MPTFRVEWWTQHGQRARNAQTADNVRELLDTIPPKSHLRIIDERTQSLVTPNAF
jgi:hypothetical protein